MEDRTKFLGGTDTAAILGLARWRTALKVWAEKTGQIEEEDISDKMQIRVGKKFESNVAELWEEDTGKKTQKVNERIYHPKYPFLSCQIDRKVVGEKSILEIKTTSAYRKEEWDDGKIPIENEVQVYHQLMVYDGKIEKAYITCLIGNQELPKREILYDKKKCDELCSRLVSFWNDYVLTKTMPMVISYTDDETLLKLFPNAEEGKEIELDDEVNIIIENLTALKQDRGSLDAQIKRFKNVLKSKIKENEIGRTSLYEIKWKNIHKDSYEVKEQNYRQIFYKIFKE